MIRSLLRATRHLNAVVDLPRAEKGLLLEALLLLALARLTVLLLPFRWLARALGAERAETPEQEDPSKVARILGIGYMLRRSARNVPWTSKCLDQALAAKIMLARRGIAATVYFGVKSDKQGRLKAHAWLRSGTLYVIGGHLRSRYTIINTFA